MAAPCSCGSYCECSCGCSPLRGCICTPSCKCDCPCTEPVTMTPIAARVAATFLEASNPVLNQDFWISREEMLEICPPCANRMASLRIKRVLASAILGQDILKMAGEETAEKWKEMPKGWDSKSRKKLWDSLGGSVSSCLKKMEGKVDDAGAYCAALADRVKKKTSWRGPNK